MRKTLKNKKPLHGGTQQEDLDRLSELIVTKQTYATYNVGGIDIDDNFKKFFEIGGNRFTETIVAKGDLNSMINTHNTIGQTLLYVACRFGTLDMIELLLTCSSINVNLANITPDASTPFIGCCFGRKKLSEIQKIFKMFLSHEIKVNKKFDFVKFTNDILNTKNNFNETANHFLTLYADKLIENFLLN
jgi:ankyrin repeat protein